MRARFNWLTRFSVPQGDLIIEAVCCNAACYVCSANLCQPGIYAFIEPRVMHGRPCTSALFTLPLLDCRVPLLPDMYTRPTYKMLLGNVPKLVRYTQKRCFLMSRLIFNSLPKNVMNLVRPHVYQHAYNQFFARILNFGYSKTTNMEQFMFLNE